MKKTVTLDGGKTLDLAANAATPFRYKQLFGADLLKLFQQNTKDESDNVLLAETISQLAFIMTKQADKADMNAVSIEEFYAWLEDYEPLDFVLASEQIINVYLASTRPSVEAKKKRN